jgi:hypothetical protein
MHTPTWFSKIQKEPASSKRSILFHTWTRIPRGAFSNSITTPLPICLILSNNANMLPEHKCARIERERRFLLD